MNRQTWLKMAGCINLEPFNIGTNLYFASLFWKIPMKLNPFFYFVPQICPNFSQQWLKYWRICWQLIITNCLCSSILIERIQKNFSHWQFPEDVIVSCSAWLFATCFKKIMISSWEYFRVGIKIGNYTKFYVWFGFVFSMTIGGSCFILLLRPCVSWWKFYQILFLSRIVHYAVIN